MEKVIHIMTLLICCVHVHHYFQNLLSSEALIARILPFFQDAIAHRGFSQVVENDSITTLPYFMMLLYDTNSMNFRRFQRRLIHYDLVNDVGLFSINRSFPNRIFNSVLPTMNFPHQRIPRIYEKFIDLWKFFNDK